MAVDSIARLKTMMRAAGAVRLYVKALSPNDNSRNQPYFGRDISLLNILPIGTIRSETLGKRPNFKVELNFFWLLEDGSLEQARHAQLILYPKYPEVRFSGFLKGCHYAPNDLMTSRGVGRLLLMGVTGDGRIIGYVVRADSSLARSFNTLGDLPVIGVFNEIVLDTGRVDARELLLNELKRVHRAGWIRSKRLNTARAFCPCEASNCGGMTLEAELGIPQNAHAEPDLHGWEIKQHAVRDLARPNTSILTLMTPEPTAGFYKEQGVIAFVRKYGYIDKKGRQDRLNFGGIHRVGERHPTTGLTMVLDGFDATMGKIIDPDGGIVLLDDQDNKAAEWKFTGIIKHWNAKHARAAYIPSVKKAGPLRYKYGRLVRLCTETDPYKLLEAMALNKVYYDPGIKIENASGARPTQKTRNQFRIHIRDIACLYSRMEQVDILL